jgi:hypothetical protein
MGVWGSISYQYDQIWKYISSKTDSVRHIGTKEDDLDMEAIESGDLRNGVRRKKKRFFGRMGMGMWGMFDRRGDFVCLLVFMLFLVCGASGLFYTYKNQGDRKTIDLSQLPPLLHGDHTDGGGGGGVSSNDPYSVSTAAKLAQYLSLNEYNTSYDLSHIMNTKCRRLTNQEIVRGRTYGSTSIPLLLETMCQVLHQDGGCKGAPRAVVPRMVNATRLAQQLILQSPRAPGVDTYLDTNTPGVIREIQEFSDLYFELAPHVSEKGEIRYLNYILEDLCIITYKDEKGICYHYINPEIKSTDGGGGKQHMIVLHNILSPDTVSVGEGAIGGDPDYTSTMANALNTLSNNIAAMATSGSKQTGSESGNDGDGSGGGGPLPGGRVDMGGKYTLLTITSRFFPFLGTHVVKIGVPIIFQYQPLVENEFVHVEALDNLIEKKYDTDDNKTGGGISNNGGVASPPNVREADDALEIEKLIRDYETYVMSKLTVSAEDMLWLHYTPLPATIGLSSRVRGYQLAMMTRILEGRYLNPSLFTSFVVPRQEEDGGDDGVDTG